MDIGGGHDLKGTAHQPRPHNRLLGDFFLHQCIGCLSTTEAHRPFDACIILSLHSTEPGYDLTCMFEFSLCNSMVFKPSLWKMLARFHASTLQTQLWSLPNSIIRLGLRSPMCDRARARPGGGQSSAESSERRRAARALVPHRASPKSVWSGCLGGSGPGPGLDPPHRLASAFRQGFSDRHRFNTER
jgi:hypothetical protein